MKILTFFWLIVFALSMHTAPRTFAQMQSNPIDTVRLIRIGIMGLGALLALGPLLPARKINLAFKSPMLYVLAYGLIALISILYAPIKFLTLWKVFEILVDVAIATVIAFYVLESGPKEFLNNVHIALGLLVLLMEVEAIIYPARAFRWYEEGFMRRQLGGVYPSMNPIMFSIVCSFVSAMSISSAINRIRMRERAFYIFLFLSSTAGTILSHSRTGMIVNSTAIILILFINRKYILLTISLILILSTILLPQTQEFWMREQTTEQLMRMTGRIPLWNIFWKTAKRSPVYGYGFYSAVRAMLNSDTTDSFYLDIFIGIGAIGLISAIFMLFSMWKEAIILTNFSLKINDPDLKELATKITSILAILTLATITGRGFSIHSESLMMFMTLVICIQAIKHGDWIQKFGEEYTESYMENEINQNQSLLDGKEKAC